MEEYKFVPGGREVVRLRRDGTYWIAPDITEGEIRQVFPDLARVAAEGNKILQDRKEAKAKNARDSKTRICHICEKRMTVGYRFAEESQVKLEVCIECIAIGLRWIVNQGRAAREIEGSPTK